MNKIPKLIDTAKVQEKSHTTVHKIGKTTFIVSSRFSEKKKHDPAAAIARLIQYNADQECKSRK